MFYLQKGNARPDHAIATSNDDINSRYLPVPTTGQNRMVSAMLSTCGPVAGVCQPAAASFTLRTSVRARPQLRMRTVSMASPELVSLMSSCVIHDPVPKALGLSIDISCR